VKDDKPIEAPAPAQLTRRATLEDIAQYLRDAGQEYMAQVVERTSNSRDRWRLESGGSGGFPSAARTAM
jgi:hypothetical protein